MLDKEFVPGSIEVISGPMFCGKTDKLVEKLHRAVIAKRGVQAFKPLIDNRYSLNRIDSHAGTWFDAVAVKDPLEIYRMIKPNTQVVGIDEAQFFDERIVRVVHRMSDDKLCVLIAGLDNDFKFKPFGPMPALLCMANVVSKYPAVCNICGGPASRTQRLIDGHPADYNDPVVMVGASELYEARCTEHHEIPGRPARRCKNRGGTT